MEKNKFKSHHKSIIVLFSYHHNNTEKIAKVISKVLNAEIKMPDQVNPEEFQDYDLIGFGSGYIAQKTTNLCLNLLISFHVPPIRMHSFSQPVE